MEKRNRFVVIFAVTLFITGCSAEPPQSKVPQAVKIPTPVAVEIDPGERPTNINGIPLMTVDQFLTPPEGHQPWAPGDWVCIEGKAKQTGIRWGAPYVIFNDSSGTRAVRFETPGAGLDGITPGMNVVVRGRVTSYDNNLAEGSFVTQKQITEALESAGGTR